LALTQRQLLDNTPEVVKLRTKICSIRLVGAGKQVKVEKLGKCYELTYNLRCLDGNRIVKVRYIGAKKPGLGENREQEDGKPDANSEVWVSCSCPYHMYNTEYALAKKGNSTIIHGNGEAPNIRNPQHVPYVCKHAVLALETSVRNVSNKTEKPEEKKPEGTLQPQPKTPVTWRKKLTDWMSGGKEQPEVPQQRQQPDPKKVVPNSSWKQKLTDWMRSEEQKPQSPISNRQPPVVVQQPETSPKGPVQQPVVDTEQEQQKSKKKTVVERIKDVKDRIKTLTGK
jgi:hypothetical protein